MKRENIDVFLEKNKNIVTKIETITKKYTLADFVKTDECFRDFVKETKKSETNELYRYLYSERQDCILEEDSVSTRLVNEYTELLYEILTSKEKIDKVFYIIAFHYLTLCKELGYKLTAQNNAPFPFLSDKMSPRAQSNYKKYEKIFEGDLYNLYNYLSKDDLNYYSKIFQEFGEHHHATKYFSLLNYIVNFDYMVGRYGFNRMFEQSLDVFIFRYKIIFIIKRIWSYECKGKIKDLLVDIDGVKN